MTAFLRRYVFQNFLLKLISLLLAIVLWAAVSRNPAAEMTVDVPIEFVNVPDNLEISTEHIPRAQVRLRGPERLVRRLQSSDIHPEIDLKGANPGERTFDLTAQQIHKPYELEVMQLVPSQFHITFDTRLTKPIEIRPRIVGNFATGYSIHRIEVDPPMTTITGPRKRVEAAESAITDPVDVSGTMGRSTFVTQAYVSDPLVQVVNPIPVRVTVIMQKADSLGEIH